MTRTRCTRCGKRSRTCDAAGVCAECVVSAALALARIGPRRCEYGYEVATHRLTWPSGSERVVCLECAASIVETAARLQHITLTVARLETAEPN